MKRFGASGVSTQTSSCAKASDGSSLPRTTVELPPTGPLTGVEPMRHLTRCPTGVLHVHQVLVGNVERHLGLQCRASGVFRDLPESERDRRLPRQWLQHRQLVPWWAWPRQHHSNPFQCPIGSWRFHPEPAGIEELRLVFQCPMCVASHVGPTSPFDRHLQAQSMLVHPLVLCSPPWRVLHHHHQGKLMKTHQVLVGTCAAHLESRLTPLALYDIR